MSRFPTPFDLRRFIITNGLIWGWALAVALAFIAGTMIPTAVMIGASVALMIAFAYDLI